MKRGSHDILAGVAFAVDTGHKPNCAVIPAELAREFGYDVPADVPADVTAPIKLTLDERTNEYEWSVVRSEEDIP